MYYLESKIYEKLPIFWNHRVISTEYYRKTDSIIWVDRISNEYHTIHILNRKTLVTKDLASGHGTSHFTFQLLAYFSFRY